MKAIVALIAILSITTPAWDADFYTWTDEKGVIHFTDDPLDVPIEYQEKADSIKIQPRSNGFPEEHSPYQSNIYTAPASEKSRTRLTEREAERIFTDIMHLWQSERWGDIWERGTPSSQSHYTKNEFIKGMELTTYRIKSYRTTSMNIQSLSIDFYFDAVFKCRSGRTCSEVKKRSELSMYYRDDEWTVWLGDIIYGGP